MEVKRRRGRPGKYPDYLLAHYGHSSRKFEAQHRIRLKAAKAALWTALTGSAWSPAMEEIAHAHNAIKVAIEVTRPAKWSKANG